MREDCRQVSAAEQLDQQGAEGGQDNQRCVSFSPSMAPEKMPGTEPVCGDEQRQGDDERRARDKGAEGGGEVVGKTDSGGRADLCEEVSLAFWSPPLTPSLPESNGRREKPTGNLVYDASQLSPRNQVGSATASNVMKQRTEAWTASTVTAVLAGCRFRRS